MGAGTLPGWTEGDPVTVRELVAVSTACGQDVHDDGYLWVDTTVVNAVQCHRRTERHSEEPVDLVDFLSGPEPARW